MKEKLLNTDRIYFVAGLISFMRGITVVLGVLNGDMSVTVSGVAAILFSSAAILIESKQD